MNEAAARIKINKLLEAAGWRFFAETERPPTSVGTQRQDQVGGPRRTRRELREDATRGFIDFLLLNEKGFPFIVLEAKAEDKSPSSARSRPASTQVSELPLCHPLQRQPALLLGPGAGQSLSHHVVPHSGLL